MFIKSIALAAALAAAGSAASAYNYFEFGETLSSSSVLDLGLVRAESDGVVEIYDDVRGEKGALLGSYSVRGGANSDVRVNIGKRPQQDVIAVLKVDGKIVAQKDFDIVR
ncbi:hypothetical protein [Yoonia sp.]|uniref:hypothetical protein n=1 Tax=Yoonia sp. TaxID=2212373 RepID=UPI001A07437C|nr:hypothetical protein [Yoonia sp.]MBE0412062.1 hypothetical protein [Yoonia sp.]